jgi:hypothetical protein
MSVEDRAFRVKSGGEGRYLACWTSRLSAASAAR